MDIYLNRKKINLKPSQAIGKGGEADVFKLTTNQAIKIFKPPEHPDYQNLPNEQKAAQIRLAEHQQKLPQFPKNLPDRVIQPQQLATDKTGTNILGYTMPLLADAEVLLRYSERSFRDRRIPNATVTSIFQNLYDTVSQLHQKGIVIGDFNDLNILVKDTNPYLIDADSFQFSGFQCKVFTSRFVDPLLCDPKTYPLLLQRPHYPDSDWYAFNIMLMQCFLFVGPYGGVYKPQDVSKKVPQDARPLHRITIFNDEVKYPKPATPYQVFSDDLLHYLYQVFSQDRRDRFPRSLLDNLHWLQCPSCGIEHARNTCPICQQTQIIPAIPPQTTVSSNVTITQIFSTEGLILAATFSNNKLYWLSYQQEQYQREDDSVILTGGLDHRLQIRLMGKTTLLGKQGQVITLKPNQSPERLAVDYCGMELQFDTNQTTRFWLQNGQLLRDGVLGSEYIGDVLMGQTRFWVGSSFGFGFYRAGNLSVTFVFDTERRGINDTVKIALGSGQLLDANCVFSTELCWFFWTMQEGGQTYHQGAVIKADGSVTATLKTRASDTPWLDNLQGKCAIGNWLFVATDEGIVRIEIQNGQIVKTREFPSTEPYVNRDSQLIAGAEGLYVVDRQTIQLCVIL